MKITVRNWIRARVGDRRINLKAGTHEVSAEVGEDLIAQGLAVPAEVASPAIPAGVHVVEPVLETSPVTITYGQPEEAEEAPVVVAGEDPAVSPAKAEDGDGSDEHADAEDESADNDDQADEQPVADKPQGRRNRRG